MDLNEERGALIQDVVKGGPAEKGGIEKGDVILKFDDFPINKMRDLTTKVANSEIGKKVRIELVRFGKNMNLTVELGRLEGNEDSYIPGNEGKTSQKILGLSFGELTQEIKRKYRVPSNIEGVAVNRCWRRFRGVFKENYYWKCFNEYNSSKDFRESYLSIDSSSQ